MASIKSTTEASFGDGNTTYVNVNTSSPGLELQNNTSLRFYSDSGSTLIAQITGGTLAPTISGSAAAIANAGTVTTASVGIARVNPASAVTGIIMQAGTFSGQQCWVVNEATTVNTVTFDVSGTSNVADGTSDVIPGLSAKLYMWDGAKSLWYGQAQLINGTINLAQSATAAATASSGTIATAGVGVARTSPAGAITGVILGAGAFAGQTCLVVNEAVIGNSVTFAASGTSNVANGIGEVIPGLSAKLYVWDSGTSLWYSVSPNLVLGTVATVQSATAAATASSGTIATAGVGVARVSPAGAVTGVILGAGAYPGQQCWVVNEAVVGNSVTFAASGTSNVANGVGEVIPGLSARLYVWDSGQSLWYSVSPNLVLGTVATVQSATAVATASSGTIATANIGVSRVNPAAAITGVILAAGAYPGQQCWVVNEAAAANTVTMAASGTSNVADGVNCVIPGLQSRLFVWDSGQSLWYETASSMVGGTIALVQGGAGDPGNNGTFTTAGVGVVRTNPAAVRTGMIMQAGTQPGQLCVVVNESAAASSVTFAASGTSNVADGVNNTIYGLQAKLFVWDSGAALWYALSTFVNGTTATVQSATAPVITNGNTITTSGVGVARVAPGGAVTGIILGAGTIPGQEVWVVNESTAANTVTFNTTPATANLASSATETAISGLTARKFVWDSSTSLWYSTRD